jgi:UDP-2,3-diacylglucosamine hydrolase
VLPAPCHIVSDLHLGAAPANVEGQFLAFLSRVEEAGGSLVINGDLFDFWFEWRSVMPRTGFRVIAKLASLRERGIEVVWLAGNHDCWGDSLLRNDLGVDYRTGAWSGRLAGWTAYVHHGDGVRPQADRSYRRVRAVLRHRWSIALFRILHPDIGSRIAIRSSAASRRHGNPDHGAELRAVAMERLSDDRALELVVFGHSHVAALQRLDGGIYANAGSWIDDPTYLLVERDRISLRRFDGSAEGECLHALDRATEEALSES